MKETAKYIYKEIDATHIQMLNQMLKCKRRLIFDLGEETYSVNFSFRELYNECTTSIGVCIDERLYYNLALENDFIKGAFGDYCSIEDMRQLPEIIRFIALDAAAEPFLENFEKSCNCKTEIVDIREENKFEDQQISIQFEITCENEKKCFHGIIKTNYEGMDWLLKKIITLPKLRERKIDHVPLNVNFELGYALLSNNEIKDVEFCDIIMLDDRLSPERSHINVNIGSSIILKGRIGSSGKIIVEDKAIKRVEDVVGKEENNKIHQVESLIENILVKLAFKVGEAQMTFADLMDLQPGYTFELNNSLEKPVKIEANGKSIGMGELVSIGDRLGVRILEFENKITEIR